MLILQREFICFFTHLQFLQLHHPFIRILKANGESLQVDAVGEVTGAATGPATGAATGCFVGEATGVLLHQDGGWIEFSHIVVLIQLYCEK